MLWGLRVCLQYLDPYKEQREQAKKRAAFLKEHLGRTLDLNEFEQVRSRTCRWPAHRSDHVLRDVQMMQWKVMHALAQHLTPVSSCLQLLAAQVMNPAHIDVELTDVMGLEVR
jgi:hypothetical protein